MRSAVRWGVLLSITSGACAGGPPPLDELPLRDTLRADPEVVAALSDDARARLAARFQTAAARDTASDAVEAGQPTPARVIAQLDVTRQARSADALLVGVLGGGAAQALPAGTQTPSTGPLPSLEGTAATATADLEARALDGAAGASLRELLAAAHAQRLQRVVGWPVGAAAMGDTVYVNGAWLVALAPATSSAVDAAAAAACADAGCDGGAPGDRWGARMSGTGGAPGWSGPSGGRPGTDGGVPPDAGAGGRPWPGPPLYTPPPVQIPPYTPPSNTPPPPDSTGGDLNDAADAADGCAALADGCASTDDGGDDSCDSQGDGSEDSCDSQDDGGDDSCSNQDEGTQQDCSTPPDDGSSADCRTAPGRGRTNVPTMLWMFAPLIYLTGRKR